MLYVGAGKSGGSCPPIFRGQVEIFWTDEIADAAALVGLGDAGPEAVEFFPEQIGFVEQNGAAGEEVEDGAVGAGDGGIKLPSGENVDAAGADGGFDDFLRSLDALAAEAGVNCAEQMLADGSFGERKEQGFVDGSGGALRGG